VRIAVAVITVSDTAARGERPADLSGQAVQENLYRFGGTLAHYEVVPDEEAIIRAELIRLVDELNVDLVLTTGGTGLAPRDRTPQATLSALDYEVPGLAEVMRAESAKVARFAYLSRAVAGVRRRSLIINLPGSPKGCAETVEILAPLIPHAIQVLRGDVGQHKPG
jgi:molybdenum cofactor synthesis domain-containing protein